MVAADKSDVISVLCLQMKHPFYEWSFLIQRYFCAVYGYGERADLSKGYWNPKRKLGVSKHFSKSNEATAILKTLNNNGIFSNSKLIIIISEKCVVTSNVLFRF